MEFDDTLALCNASEDATILYKTENSFLLTTVDAASPDSFQQLLTATRTKLVAVTVLIKTNSPLSKSLGITDTNCCMEWYDGCCTVTFIHTGN